MIRKEKEDLQWLEFELLSGIPHLAHGVLLRQGGYSKGAFSSLNLSKKVGDTLSDVETNLEKVKALFGLSFLYSSQLTHGKEVISVTLHTLNQVHLCDGLSTVHQGIALLNTHADCQVAIFYDPIQHALANVHCGWRGSVQNIYKETIWHMQTRYGSKPCDLLVGISPSLGPDSAEFVNYSTELPASFWSFQVKPNYFDFWSISQWQLMEAGILADHIQIAGEDTFANSKDYFSYRRDKITGRQGTFACLR